MCAVQALRQDPRHGGLAGATRACEEIGPTDLATRDRVLERPHDGLLADDLVEGLRAVLAVESGHGSIQADPSNPKPAPARSAMWSPIARQEVAPGEGALRTWRDDGPSPKTKSSTRPPSRVIACARMPEPPRTTSAALSPGR